MKKIILSSLFVALASLSTTAVAANNLTLPSASLSAKPAVKTVVGDVSLLTPEFIKSLTLKDNYYQSIAPQPEYPSFVNALVEEAEKSHYLHINLVKPEHRTKALDIYLEQLDPQKAIFTRSEVEALHQKYTAGVKKGFIRDIDSYAKIYAEFAQKAVDNYRFMATYVQSLQSEPNLNLTQEFKRAKYANYLETQQQINDFSKVRVISDIINVKLDKPNFTWPQIRERLLKAYRYRVKMINTLSPSEVFDIYARSLSLALDTHSEYSSPDQIKELQESLRSTFDGIGVHIKQADDGIISFPSIIDNGPAKAEGTIAPKDELLAVSQDGKTWVDIDGWTLNRVVKIIKGKSGTPVWLRLMDVEGKIKEAKITRGPINKENISARIDVFTNDAGDKYAILKFGQFYQDLAKDIAKVFKEHPENFKGVIVDIRNNGGGLVNELLQMSSIFLQPLNTIFQISNSDAETKGLAQLSRSIYGEKLYYDGPLIVMVNGNSASASEIFAAAVQDYKRGVVLGATSFGKGTVQSYMPLGMQFYGVLKSTIQKFYRVNGETTQFKGVEPDVTLPDTKTDIFNEANSINPLSYSTIQPANYTPFKGYVTPEILKAMETAKTKYIAAHPDLQKFNGYLTAQKEEAQSQTYQVNFNRTQRLISGLRDFMLEKYNAIATKENKPTITTLEDADNAVMDKVDLHLDVAKELIQVYSQEYYKNKK